MDEVIHYHLLNHALLVVAEAVAEVTAEAAATAGHDPLQEEREASNARKGDHRALATGALREGKVPLYLRVGSTAQHLMKAVLPKMGGWLLSKMGLSTAIALGRRAEALSALKVRNVLVAGIKVLPMLMVAVAVPALWMIGALLVKMIISTSLQEEVCHHEVSFCM